MDRITQAPVEVAVAPTSGKARVTQIRAEVAVAPTSAKARITQLPVEVVSQNVLTVDLDLIDNTAIAFAPVTSPFEQTLFFGRINRTGVAFTPTITPFTQNLTFARINRQAVAFTPTITRTTNPRIDQFAVAFAPTVSHVPWPPPPRGSPVRFIVEGLGDIAPLVVWRLTELNTAVGGVPSLGFITIRDIGFDPQEFILGKRVTVDLGPGTRPLWTGYLLRGARRFWFSVDKPDTMQRQWRLHVVDINILFTRRVAYRKSDPANPTGPKYVTDTQDTTALQTLFDDWLDVEDDDLNLIAKVMPVGNINDGQVVYPWNGGMSMSEAVRNIAQLPAAVYGFNPLRQLVYADVDEENAPFILHDVAGPGRVGYREVEILFDGAALINDALCWGAGKGSNEMVFRRLEDAASQAEHGLWQDSFTSFAVWKQSTIDKVADSIINGSPQSKRGHKDDRLEVRCVIHDHGLMVGDRVRFVSNIWDVDEVLPVRKMKLTFPTPWDVRYDLVLSHEIDRWGFEDPLPRLSIPGIDVIVDLPPVIDIGIEEPCVNATTEHTNFALSAGTVAGPFLTAIPPAVQRMWAGSQWLNWAAEKTGVLSFPGTEEPHLEDPSLHLNKVSGFIDRGTIVYIDFEAHSGGGGIDPVNQGLMGPGQNTIRGAHIAPWEVPTNFADGDENFIYYWFGGTYNPDLTGSGTYRFMPRTMGTAADSAGISGGIGRMTIVDNAWGQRQLYAATAPWNKDVITGRFRFRFDQLATVGTPHAIEFTYGAAKVEIRPSTDTGGEVRLVTGSGEDAIAQTTWTEDQWYILEIALDLPNDTARSRLWLESTPGTVIEIERATDGERVGDGDYRPFLGIWLENTSATPYTVELSETVSNIYGPATVAPEEFGDAVAETVNGWGDPWYTRTSPTVLGNSAGIVYSSVAGAGEAGTGHAGTIRILNSALPITGYIERPMGGGALDISFALSGYTPANDVVAMHFATSGSSKLFQAFLGNALQITVQPGVSSSVASTLFTGGQPVNVRLQVFAGGMRLKVWAAGDPEPSTWTLERLFTPTLVFGQFVWAIDPAFVVTGRKVTIGPIEGAGAVLPQVGPDIMRVTGVQPISSAASAAGLGRFRSWPFEDPGDGRAYATAWGTDQWIVATGVTPSYSALITWGLFNDEGPGAPTSVTQQVAALALPAFTIGGIPVAFDVIIRGELGMSLGGHPIAGGTGLATATAILKTYGYGNQPLPVPGHSEYFIGGGGMEAAFTSDLVGDAGVTVWHPFALKTGNGASNGGVSNNGAGAFYYQWGVEVLNAFDTIRSAGPLSASGFIALPNWGSVTVSVRNISYELVLKPVAVIGLQRDPCAPIVYEIDPDSAGAQGETAVRVSSTVYSTKAPYVPRSLMVFVNGDIQRWGIDFTETSPTTFTFASPVDVADVVDVLYSVAL